MKHLFWGIALLLATTAAAQSQPGKMSVMRTGDPDLFLELKHPTAPLAKPVQTAQPDRSAQAAQLVNPDHLSAAESDQLAEYLLHLAAWEFCLPDNYLEELKQLHQGGKTLTADQFEYLIWAQRLKE